MVGLQACRVQAVAVEAVEVEVVMVVSARLCRDMAEVAHPPRNPIWLEAAGVLVGLA